MSVVTNSVIDCVSATDPMMKEGEKRVREFGPYYRTIDYLSRALLPHKVVIAGGAIRDMFMVGEHMIKDYDVWVLGVDEGIDVALDQKLREVYEHTAGVAAAHPNFITKDYEKLFFGRPRFNIVLPWVPEGRPTQIMYSPVKTMAELVSAFDWRACSFGFDGNELITDGTADFDNKQLSLNDTKLGSPRNTLRRGFRIEEKYRYSPTPWRLWLTNELILGLAAMLTF